jgi:heterodisulfide reductase subunit C
MTDIIEQLAKQHALLLCVDCGKCVAVCPMWEIFDDFSYEVSPRGVIKMALSGQATLAHVGVWVCLTCDLCTRLCPMGVRFRDFIEAARQLALEAGAAEHGYFCQECGAYLCPEHTVAYLRQTLGEAGEELLGLCTRCRQVSFGKKVKALVRGRRGLLPTEEEDNR